MIDLFFTITFYSEFPAKFPRKITHDMLRHFLAQSTHKDLLSYCKKYHFYLNCIF